MKFPFFSETPLWLVLVHWYGLLLIAIFELLHNGDGWLAALPWGHWSQALAAGWRNGQLSAGALFLLYLNVLMLASGLLLLYVFVKVLAANRWHEVAPHGLSSRPAPTADAPVRQAIAETVDGGVMQKPEVVALVSHFREQLKRIAVAGTGTHRR
jgi:hypothetical protein